MTSEGTKEVLELGHRVAQELAGNQSEVVIMVLADMVALWLAGHIGPAEEVAEFRKTALAKFIASVEALVPVNERILLEGIRGAKKH